MAAVRGFENKAATPVADRGFMRVFAMLLFAAIAYGQTDSARLAEDSTPIAYSQTDSARLAEQQVADLEDQWCKAWVAADAAALDRIHADDYVAVNNIGALSPNPQ
jgi:hypothetical protein